MIVSKMITVCEIDPVFLLTSRSRDLTNPLLIASHV